MFGKLCKDIDFSVGDLHLEAFTTEGTKAFYNHPCTLWFNSS